MIKTSGQGGHSAQVKILETAAEHPPGDATLELRIDTSERRWKVRLPHGISRASRTVTISRVN